jgi:hypothetical protein
MKILSIGTECVKTLIPSLLDIDKSLSMIENDMYEFTNDSDNFNNPSDRYKLVNKELVYRVCFMMFKENNHYNLNMKYDLRNWIDSFLDENNLDKIDTLKHITSDLNIDDLDKMLYDRFSNLCVSTSPSSYEINCKSMLFHGDKVKSQFCYEKSLGFVISSIFIVLNDLINKEKNKDKVNAHIERSNGIIENMKAKVISAKFINTYYGESFLIKFETSEGIITSFTTSKKIINLRENDEVVLSAKIKDFNEYKGKKETIVTRIKLKD